MDHHSLEDKLLPTTSSEILHFGLLVSAEPSPREAAPRIPTLLTRCCGSTTAYPINSTSAFFPCGNGYGHGMLTSRVSCSLYYQVQGRARLWDGSVGDLLNGKARACDISVYQNGKTSVEQLRKCSVRLSGRKRENTHGKCSAAVSICGVGTKLWDLLPIHNGVRQ